MTRVVRSLFLIPLLLTTACPEFLGEFIKGPWCSEADGWPRTSSELGNKLVTVRGRFDAKEAMRRAKEEVKEEGMECTDTVKKERTIWGAFVDPTEYVIKDPSADPSYDVLVTYEDEVWTKPGSPIP